ncbi:MAG: protein kinase, partial [Pyrinomonadaceae bacterium]
MKECPTCKCCLPDSYDRCPTDGSGLSFSFIGDPLLEDRYQLEHYVGRGGMGVVYKGRHVFLKTSHAIKVILPELVGSDPGLITRFRQEAMVAASIRHQNVVTVTDFGVAHGKMPFLVMDFIQGQSLQDLLEREGSLSPEKALEILVPAAAGVGAAHRQHIVHRDLKPLNIMLQDGLPIQEAVKVLDFGLAKIKSGDMFGSFVLAQTTALMGSPFYMAPEQWSEDEPDARADIYSMGIILFQMLSGDVPFKGTGIPIIMKKHMIDNPPSFESVGVDVPLAVEAVVHRALEKEPGKRPQSIEDFVEEFREAVGGRSLAVTQLLPERPVKKASPTRSRTKKRTGTTRPLKSKPSVEELMVEAHRHFKEEQERLASTEKEKAAPLEATKPAETKHSRRLTRERKEQPPEPPAPTIYVPPPEPKRDSTVTQPALAAPQEAPLIQPVIQPEPKVFTTSSDSKVDPKINTEIQIPWQQSRPSLQ